ncbi:putative integral membrane protein [Theileria parva strain Muguga]|uniref:Tash1 protein, putative n=1 Tax=Theileria parva TaxID=5875 RepID=Q4N864_THEPA|nr:uncharacterized protein TpMuguga_01g00606 [Theileria parva strain Muguga]EAN33844.1 putative integral membrane protein [Theileria parva strain Muguga]|eukprot:XP_766127.1 hypothetical protein [Theileria parva strain Muguga]
MVRVNILLLFYALIVYCIKTAFSNVLDLKNISNSGFWALKIVEGNITKTMIYSTADRPITKVRQGTRVIWEPYSYESVKCVTHYSFELHNKILMTIEISDPVVNDMYYFKRRRTHYVYISKKEFEYQFTQLSHPPPVFFQQTKPKKPKKSKTATGNTGKSKKPRKRKADTDDEEPLIITTHIPTNKPAQPQPQPQPQPLEPEVVQVAVESEDDEECSEVQQLQPSIDNSMLLSEAVFNQEVENLLETDFDDMGLSKTQLDSLFYKTTDESIKPDKDEKDLELENIIFEISTDDEEPTKEQTSQLIRQKLREKIQKKQQRQDLIDKFEKKNEEKSYKTSELDDENEEESET